MTIGFIRFVSKSSNPLLFRIMPSESNDSSPLLLMASALARLADRPSAVAGQLDTASEAVISPEASITDLPKIVIDRKTYILAAHVASKTTSLEKN
jgi:hypothetical protein